MDLEKIGTSLVSGLGCQVNAAQLAQRRKLERGSASRFHWPTSRFDRPRASKTAPQPAICPNPLGPIWATGRSALMGQGNSRFERTLAIKKQPCAPSCAAISSATIPANEGPPHKAALARGDRLSEALGVLREGLAFEWQNPRACSHERERSPLMAKEPGVDGHPW